MIFVSECVNMRSSKFDNQEVKIENKIIELISSKIDCGCKINLCSESPFDELHLNSIAFIQIVVEIENAFQIEFDDDHLSTEFFNSIKDLVNYVDEKNNNKINVERLS